ncbi:choice-of-anchor D domain-containing protein [Hymenobacter sp. 102]|uniref:choice-of-anchor D domain-containing protein n=1 Tax=Hymenobacter sp. 102 TaxID=3403152 RepID=UPI003CF25D2E
MKKPYSAVDKPQRWLQLFVVWILLLLPGLGYSQTFVEAMGSTATEGQSVDSYESNLGFDNDNEKGFSYQATGSPLPVLSLANPSTGSAGPNILFAPTSGTNSIFSIASISTAGFSSASLTFQLNAPAGAFTGTAVTAGNQRFRVQLGIGTVSNTNGNVSYSYTNLPFTYAPGSAGGWGLATVNLPSNAIGNPYVAIRFIRINNTSNTTGDYRIDDVTLSGTTTGVVTAVPSALDFGDVAVGTNSTQQVVRVSGQDLTGNVSLTAPAGYQIRVFGSGSYVQSLTLATTNGILPSTRIQVRFAPTAAGPADGTLVVSSPGVPSAEVDLTGNGTVPTLAATPASLDFGTTFVGQTTASQTVTVTGTNVVSNVTVTAPTGFQVRRTASDSFSQSIVVTPADANAGFTFEAVFQPTTAGSYSSAINITTPNASTSVAVTGQANPVPTGPFIVVNPSSLDFGTVSATGSAQTLSFSVNAGNLTAPLVLTGSNNNIVFRDASAGGSFTNGPLTINPVNGTVSTRTIEVQLTGPIASGPFNGSITASSTGAQNQVVSITANSTGNNSVINASGTLNQFSTVPGVPSASQSYTLSGSNLLQDITVSAPQYFQVSQDPTFGGSTVTGNSIVVARNSGSDVTATTIYVRFIPPSALTTSSLILNTSSPAVAQGIPVAGTSEPSIQIMNAFQEVRNVVINTVSASQSLMINAQRVLQPVTISKVLSTNPLNPGNTPQFELSLDNVTFSNSVVLTPNSTTYTINQPIYVRYKPTYLGTAQSTLQFQSNDFANKSVQSFGANDQLAGRSIDTEPTLRSNATVVRNGTTATVSFNLPANYAQLGYGEGRLIVASTNSELPAANQPSDGVSYQTGNQTYGQGPQIAPGYYAVYSGANQTVVIDGLDLGTTYYFYTFEYNNIDNSFNVSVIGAENYLSPPVPNTIPGIVAPSPLPVTLVSFSAKVKGNQVALNWVTASELNNKHFEVQRSRDGRTFETILVREGKGTTSTSSTYAELDSKPLNGVSYYRLKQVDTDGSSSFSSTVTVNFLSSGDVTMYPNPVEDLLTVDMGGSAAGVSAVITDMTGRVISTQRIGNDSKLNMTSLQPGTYMVTVGSGEAKVTRRITKK